MTIASNRIFQAWRPPSKPSGLPRRHTLSLRGLPQNVAATVCEWRDAENLDIYFSPIAQIGSKGMLYAAPGSLRTSVHSIYGSCGQVQPVVPQDISPPAIEIFSPKIVGPCDQFIAVARIEGTGGRQSMHWSLTSPSPLGSAASKTIRNIEASSEDVFVIPPSVLPAGDVYQLSLFVSPVIGPAGNSTAWFDQSSVSLPLLSVGPKEAGHLVDQAFVRKIDARSPLCSGDSGL